MAKSAKLFLSGRVGKKTSHRGKDSNAEQYIELAIAYFIILTVFAQSNKIRFLERGPSKVNC